MTSFDYIWHLDTKYSKNGIEFWFKNISKYSFERVIIYFRLDENKKRINKNLAINFSKLEDIDIKNPSNFYQVIFSKDIRFKKYKDIIDHFDLYNKKIKFIQNITDVYE